LTRIPFNLDGGKTWDSPSLDRINNAKGYTPENVRVVLYCVNVMANIWGENKIIEIAEAIMGARRAKSANLQARLNESLKRRMDLNASLEYVLTWKEQDMPAGVPLCRLQALERPTEGKGFSSWPTPNTMEGGQTSRGGDRKDEKLMGGLVGWATPQTEDSGCSETARKRGENLAVMAAWATPRAEDAESAGMRHSRGVADTLSAQVGQDLPLSAWPTASARDWKDSEGMSETGINPDGSERTRHDQLPRVAQLVMGSWATPKTSDANGIREEDGKRCVGLNTQASGAITTSSPAETEKRGALNPAHSRWLMGYRPVWDDCAVTAMPSSRKSRQSS
jgi:hypothetical protein